MCSRCVNVVYNDVLTAPEEMIAIPFILEVADVLASFIHPNHIVIYAHRDELACRLSASSSLLGIFMILFLTILNIIAFHLWREGVFTA